MRLMFLANRIVGMPEAIWFKLFDLFKQFF